MHTFQGSNLLSVCLSILSLSSFALCSYHPQLEILYWPVTNPEPAVLALVSYDPASLKSDLIDYFPPTDLSQGLSRLGFYIATSKNPKQWVGTLTSSSTLKENDMQKPTLHLHIGPSSEIYHVSLSSTAASTFSSDSLRVELVTGELGPSPHLNRPVVIGPDGKNPQEEPEKTLFQKYWWVFLIITFLAMSGGGEQQ
ncbi:hypothetical protein BDW62DRAFT_212889 [Aspergillus aurantiobrunneus]